MSTYTMILHECDGTLTAIDGPGSPYNNLAAARAGAIQLARDVMSNEIRHGRLCLTCWIVIKNERGHTVMTVPFGEAVALRDHPVSPESV